MNKDRTEELYQKHFSGAIRERLIEQHRKEKFFLEKKLQEEKIKNLKEQENARKYIDSHKREMEFAKKYYEDHYGGK
jgi:hypothetical protein